MSDLKEFKSIAKEHTVLYVEDNKALRLNAAKLLGKFFERVDVAEDGVAGLQLFKKNHYHLVITDIKMPNMDGIELVKRIKNIQPATKVVIMSAFDDKEYLLKSIESGVFRYLQKPVNVSELTGVLHIALQEIKHEKNTQIFYTNMQNVFNYQSSMVMMLNRGRPLLANQIFLDFFGVDSLEEFTESYGDLSRHFMEHSGFLYDSDEERAINKLQLNDKKLFHIKMKNQKGEIKHLIVKYQIIPEKSGYGILSFDDVTELKLLKLFDSKQSQLDDKEQDSKAMFDLLEVIQRNSAKIELHNYYKGLSITNDGVIAEVKDESLVLKTLYMQLKAVQHEKKTIIVSEALPSALECMTVVKIGFENQNIELTKLRFMNSSPITRKTIRVIPEEKHSVSLFLGENKFHGDVRVEDISLDAVKLNLNALPAGLQIGDEVIVDIVLELNKKPLIINTKATMLRKSESRYSFSVVLLFKDLKTRELVKYITSRQMSIIREFKGLQNG
ncbi:MAG: response regulator [Campylobacterota bacterium]|nr:response regulator [Campylobacterota bacterium]